VRKLLQPIVGQGSPSLYATRHTTLWSRAAPVHPPCHNVIEG
jgi:hypothetical protein